MSIKHLLQGTAIGLFIATSVFSAVYFFGDFNKDNDNVEDLTIEEAITLLEGEKYSVIEDEELERLYNDIEQLELIIEENSQVIVDDENKDDDVIADENEQEVVQEEEVEQVEEFVLEIKPGVHSRNIGEVLKKFGIVEDERDFERYVLEKEVDRKIQIGEFKLKSDMSVDDIIKIITK